MESFPLTLGLLVTKHFNLHIFENENEKEKNLWLFNDPKILTNVILQQMGRFWVGSMGPEPEPTKVIPEQGSLVSLTLMYSVHQSKPLAGCSPASGKIICGW